MAGASTQPAGYALEQNYPNPFNPVTDIIYAIPASSHVSVDIFNTMGQKVKTLVDQYMTAGTYQTKWDAKDDFGATVPSGVYLCRLNANGFGKTIKMTLAR
jgi:flagellar hook assembly protein FlgD